MTGKEEEGESAFRAEGDSLETPFYQVKFDEKGYLEALTDKRNGRRIRGEGYALNTFLMAEEVPLSYDNWDVDADSECKYADTAQLLSRQVVADGAVEYRIRSTYRLTAASTLTQDMIFYAERPEIVFETKMDWQEDHRFLKAAFDTAVHTDYASQEIQFGYIRRPVNRNTSVEKAKFEVSNHKYTDLSETRYGIAVLNDCKYGISLNGGSMRLSLHKGGNRPDYRGDKGIHFCTYALLPHLGSMDAENVIRPAYLLNEKPIIVSGHVPLESLLSIDAPNVIAETVKPAEDAGNCFVVRLYEAEGTCTPVRLAFPGLTVRRIEETNMLEETTERLEVQQEISLTFRPFEIKTLKIAY
nr:glycoside hydrolase family 38 C-terminal domain-containing protein [uncultured Acetatifactor sp.]